MYMCNNGTKRYCVVGDHVTHAVLSTEEEVDNHGVISEMFFPPKSNSISIVEYPLNVSTQWPPKRKGSQEQNDTGIIK